MRILQKCNIFYKTQIFLAILFPRIRHGMNRFRNRQRCCYVSPFKIWLGLPLAISCEGFIIAIRSTDNLLVAQQNIVIRICTIHLFGERSSSSPSSRARWRSFQALSSLHFRDPWSVLGPFAGEEKNTLPEMVGWHIVSVRVWECGCNNLSK